MNAPDTTLDAFRRDAQLSASALWWSYFALGGNATPRQLQAFLTGATRPDRTDHDRLAQALNEQFTHLGRDSPVPYFEQLHQS